MRFGDGSRWNLDGREGWSPDAPERSREPAHEGEQGAGDNDRGEREGNLEKKPDKKRRLEGGMEWKIARLQYALQMLLEGKTERRSKRKQHQ